ncbi:WYL domain-containing protein [Verrucomicrobium sp. GAS474]|nr:WYL domain-containing protein [Verrucomicrobium sp. GAS474]
MSQTLICGAIRDRKLISFFYKDGERVVEPYLVGLNEKNHVELVAWFVRGYSKSGRGMAWKQYLLSEMTSIRVLDEECGPRHSDYNPNDSRMSQIYCRV